MKRRCLTFVYGFCVVLGASLSAAGQQELEPIPLPQPIPKDADAEPAAQRARSAPSDVEGPALHESSEAPLGRPARAESGPHIVPKRTEASTPKPVPASRSAASKRITITGPAATRVYEVPSRTQLRRLRRLGPIAAESVSYVTVRQLDGTLTAVTTQITPPPSVAPPFIPGQPLRNRWRARIR
jgi:hypothetical protein